MRPVLIWVFVLGLECVACYSVGGRSDTVKEDKDQRTYSLGGQEREDRVGKRNVAVSMDDWRVRRPYYLVLVPEGPVQDLATAPCKHRSHRISKPPPLGHPLTGIPVPAAHITDAYNMYSRRPSILGAVSAHGSSPQMRSEWQPGAFFESKKIRLKSRLTGVAPTSAGVALPRKKIVAYAAPEVPEDITIPYTDDEIESINALEGGNTGTNDAELVGVSNLSTSELPGREDTGGKEIMDDKIISHASTHRPRTEDLKAGGIESSQLEQHGFTTELVPNSKHDETVSPILNPSNMSGFTGTGSARTPITAEEPNAIEADQIGSIPEVMDQKFETEARNELIGDLSRFTPILNYPIDIPDSGDNRHIGRGDSPVIGEPIVIDVVEDDRTSDRPLLIDIFEQRTEVPILESEPQQPEIIETPMIDENTIGAPIIVEHVTLRTPDLPFAAGNSMRMDSEGVEGSSLDSGIVMRERADSAELTREDRPNDPVSQNGQFVTVSDTIYDQTLLGLMDSGNETSFVITNDGNLSREQMNAITPSYDNSLFVNGQYVSTGKSTVNETPHDQRNGADPKSTGGTAKNREQDIKLEFAGDDGRTGDPTDTLFNGTNVWNTQYFDGKTNFSGIAEDNGTITQKQDNEDQSIGTDEYERTFVNGQYVRTNNPSYRPYYPSIISDITQNRSDVNDCGNGTSSLVTGRDDGSRTQGNVNREQYIDTTEGFKDTFVNGQYLNAKNFSYRPNYPAIIDDKTTIQGNVNDVGNEIPSLVTDRDDGNVTQGNGTMGQYIYQAGGFAESFVNGQYVNTNYPLIIDDKTQGQSDMNASRTITTHGDSSVTEEKDNRNSEGFTEDTFLNGQYVGSHNPNTNLLSSLTDVPAPIQTNVGSAQTLPEEETFYAIKKGSGDLNQEQDIIINQSAKTLVNGQYMRAIEQSPLDANAMPTGARRKPIDDGSITFIDEDAWTYGPGVDESNAARHKEGSSIQKTRQHVFVNGQYVPIGDPSERQKPNSDENGRLPVTPSLDGRLEPPGGNSIRNVKHIFVNGQYVPADGLRQRNDTYVGATTGKLDKIANTERYIFVNGQYVRVTGHGRANINDTGRQSSDDDARVTQNSIIKDAGNGDLTLRENRTFDGQYMPVGGNANEKADGSEASPGDAPVDFYTFVNGQYVRTTGKRIGGDERPRGYKQEFVSGQYVRTGEPLARTSGRTTGITRIPERQFVNGQYVFTGNLDSARGRGYAGMTMRGFSDDLLQPANVRYLSSAGEVATDKSGKKVRLCIPMLIDDDLVLGGRFLFEAGAETVPLVLGRECSATETGSRDARLQRQTTTGGNNGCDQSEESHFHTVSELAANVVRAFKDLALTADPNARWRTAPLIKPALN